MSFVFWISKILGIRQNYLSVSNHINQHLGPPANHANVILIKKYGKRGLHECIRNSWNQMWWRGFIFYKYVKNWFLRGFVKQRNISPTKGAVIFRYGNQCFTICYIYIFLQKKASKNQFTQSTPCILEQMFLSGCG